MKVLTRSYQILILELFLNFVHVTSVSSSLNACADTIVDSSMNQESHFTSNGSDNDKLVEDKMVGGGAINEKKRRNGNYGVDVLCADNEKSVSSSFDRTSISHRLHAMVGLDRYPNYLLRWNNIDDIEELEASLESQIEMVRNQKQLLEERKNLASNLIKCIQEADSDHLSKYLKQPNSWEELISYFHPLAVKAIFNKRFFKKNPNLTVQSVCKRGCPEINLDPGPLEALIDLEPCDVYSFLLLSDEICHALVEMSKKISAASVSESDESRQRLGNRPVTLDLDQFGLEWLNNVLFNVVIRPLSRLLFAGQEFKGELDWRQGYIAGYSSKPSKEAGIIRNHLVSHTDDSELTFNLCLGEKGFDGGDLVFDGLRGEPEQYKRHGTYSPQIGKAILHAGKHLHAVNEVKSGNRYVLIIWSRSWKGERATVCPCCWLNNRKETREAPCIVGPMWN